jgi:DNA-binding MarR family transcriptional regulator
MRVQIWRLECELFRFKSDLSIYILLCLAQNGGTCEMPTVFKFVRTTAVATRQHIQALEARGLVTLEVIPDNRRSKLIRLSAKGEKLMNSYEMRLQAIISWASVGPSR